MQEDSYYSSYLSSKTNERVVVSKDEAHLAAINQRIAGIEVRLPAVIRASDRTDSSIKGLRIGVNHFLNDKAEIEKHLAELGVMGYTEFGGMEPPDERVVAVSQYLTEEVQRSILRIARTLGFKLYTPYDNAGEESEEDVLFGAYGKSNRIIAGSA